MTQEEIQLIIQEIQQLYKQAEQTSKVSNQNLRLLHILIQELMNKSQTLNNQLDQLIEKMTTTSLIFSKNQKASIWQRYWMAIIMGILSLLITNLIWIFT